VKQRQLRLGLLGSFVLAATLAHAEGPPDPNAKQLFLAGQQAYDAGRYEVAIRAFAAAQALSPSDLLTFDLAQSYRKKFLALGDFTALDKAVELYRRFLATSATGRERPMATDAIAELLTIAAKRPDPTPAPEPRAPERQTAETEIMIVSEAAGALVALDGKEPSRAPLFEVVTPGPHRARATAPGFEPADATVTAVAGRFVVSELQLKPLPATLQLSASRPGTLELDGVGMGALPARPIRIASGHHHLQIRLRGYQPWERDVDVDRGAHLELRARLRPTVQRRAVRWLGAAAGLVGVGTIVAGIVWGTSYRTAAAIYAREMRGLIAGGDIDVYNQALATNDQARVATEIGAALGGTLALTTLLLYLVEPQP
jgi:hypothetical protein